MASSVVAFAFLVLCCVACAKAQTTVALNVACNATKLITCTDGAHVCDTNLASPVCKIKAEETCSTTEQCVTGSTCKAESDGTQKCKCTADISTIDGDKRCAPKAGYLGGACDSKGQCTAGKGICGTGNKCICGTQTGVTTNYATYTCTPPAGYIGAACENNNPCTALNATCVRSQCNCVADYTVTYTNYTCVEILKSGGPTTGVSAMGKSGSSMLLMSTFLVTIVSSLSKMMM